MMCESMLSHSGLVRMNTLLLLLPPLLMAVPKPRVDVVGG
jgi:hypothetical protein